MNHKFLNILTGKLIFLLLIAIGIFSCNNNQSKIPIVAVDIWININDPLFYDLQVPGNYIYINGGVNGIIVYRSSTDEFTAFERTCPYDPECGKVYMEEGSLSIAVDSICCGSEFSLLIDGAVTLGPSKFPLKRYFCEYNSYTQELHIKN